MSWNAATSGSTVATILTIDGSEENNLPHLYKLREKFNGHEARRQTHRGKEKEKKN